MAKGEVIHKVTVEVQDTSQVWGASSGLRYDIIVVISGVGTLEYNDISPSRLAPLLTSLVFTAPDVFFPQPGAELP